MILSAFLLLFCAVFTWKVFPKKHEAEGPHGGSRGTEQAYDTLDQVKQCTLSICSSYPLHVLFHGRVKKMISNVGGATWYFDSRGTTSPKLQA
jgi:hypothetical protein